MTPRDPAVEPRRRSPDAARPPRAATVRRLVGRLPLLGPWAARVGRRRRVRRAKHVLERIARSPAPRSAPIAAALGRLDETLTPAESDWVARIESGRRALGLREEPLVDGSLGPGGLYDAGVSVAGACGASKAPRSALLLFLLVRALAPRRVLELGTNVGISSAYVGAALQVDGGGGRLATLDASPYRQRLARALHRELGLTEIAYTTGLFRDTLAPTLQAVGPVDLAFVDGHHEYRPTLDYTEQILEHAAEDAVLVFDDIRWSEGMRHAWSELRADPRFGLTVDLQSMGVCVRATDAAAPRHASPPLPLR